MYEGQSSICVLLNILLLYQNIIDILQNKNVGRKQKSL